MMLGTNVRVMSLQSNLRVQPRTTPEEWSSGRELRAVFMSSREIPAHPVDEITSWSTACTTTATRISTQSSGGWSSTTARIARWFLFSPNNFICSSTTKQLIGAGVFDQYVNLSFDYRWQHKIIHSSRLTTCFLYTSSCLYTSAYVSR